MGDTHNGKAVNCRQMLTDRSSTRIFHPPGGASSFSLGGGGPWDGATVNRKQNPSNFASSKAKLGGPSYGGDSLDNLVGSLPGGPGKFKSASEEPRYIPGLTDLRESSHNSSKFESNDRRDSQKAQHFNSNSYASQLREQIEMKKRLDDEMEQRFNPGHGYAPPNLSNGSYQHGNSYQKARSAPAAPTGRRGYNPVGGASSFSLGW